MNKFDVLFEQELERFQQGGVIIGDRVRFKKNCLKLDYIKNRAQSFHDIIRSCMDPKFDLNLRVGAVKSIYPTSATNFQAGQNAPDGVFLDIYIEYAPGLYRNPMTVPIEAIEVISDGVNRGPVPKSLRRPNKIHNPEPIKPVQQDIDSNLNLTAVDTTLPGANKWDDTKPGGGNFKVKVKN
jgi:hypothetical protein